MASQSAGARLRELQAHQIELEVQNAALRQDQLALEESRDRYRDLYEFAPVGYLTLSADGFIEDINLTGASLLDEDRQKLRRQDFARYLAGKDRRKWRQTARRLMQRGDSSTVEIGLRRRDGSIVHVSMECRVSSGPDLVRFLRATLTDITELKQALAALQMREDRLQLVKAVTAVGSFDYDFVSEDHQVDERLREIFGFEPADPITLEQFMACLHPDDRADVQARTDRALNSWGSGSYSAQYRLVNRRDGSIRHVVSNGQVFFRDGQAIRFVGIVRDISAERQLEGEMQARRNAMELLVNQQVASQTAAAFAHELNQPLVSISTYTEAAMRLLRKGSASPEKLLRALEGAQQQALRAGRTLQELLNFLQKGEAVTEALDLRHLIREAIVIAGEGGYGQFQPVLEIEPGLPTVLANSLQVQKVLVNLLHNSLEAMHTAGVTSRVITISASGMEGLRMTRVAVRDTGPGFDKDSAKRAFEPFFTTKSNGVGLGLPISRALIEANGGQMWVAFEAGSGGAVHFSLPFAPGYD